MKVQCYQVWGECDDKSYVKGATSSLPPDPQAMVLAVANEHGAVLINEDAVGTGKLAVEWVAAIGPIALLAVAHEDFDHALFDIKVADGVRLCISEIDIAFRIQANGFWTSERCLKRRAAITLEA